MSNLDRREDDHRGRGNERRYRGEDDRRRRDDEDLGRR
jgi:hypothetical protein